MSAEPPHGIDVLRVFCGPDGRHGNALGVVRDGRAHPDQASRQALARELGFSETVFVDDPERGVVDIHTPGARLPFAGHPLVGVAWLLDLEVVHPPAGEVWVRQDGEFTWITARAEWAPPRTLRQYASAAEVEELDVPEPGERSEMGVPPTPEGLWGRSYAWAWEDEAGGRIRARAFPGRGDGIDEDEATGAAALLLTARLDRALNIVQGRGSQILTAPGPDGTIEVGGRVRLV
ncbi:PhzF family phenazine biosynthesis protein [Streptomyces formicae]|uniref:PhzF family phenazine biosynthesis protein n=1 Tax=Streptomyces formicae TaxID=1616117 RepID=A0ABY3WQ43_9ACTN|nr:PhzF family phenazine biosynthesis protein [Streptomyces formicae]UNM14761.1 PhzF family phenazine biosynthesis protein [Streptomyces formicae]